MRQYPQCRPTPRRRRLRFMPNGKPGDHPVTDLVVWGRKVFSERVNTLIREIDTYTTDYGVFDPFEDLDSLIFRTESNPVNDAELIAALTERKDQLAAGTYPGLQVPE